MHINMKYYVVTIGAIFLALGVGIIVGFNLNNNEELSKQQAEIISELDEEFGTIKTEKAEIEKNLSEKERKYNELINYVNETKLSVESISGKNVAVISTYGKSSSVDTAKNIVQNHEGNVAFELIFNKEIIDEELIAKASKETGSSMKTTEDVVSYVFDSIKKGDTTEKLSPLQDLNIIDFVALSDNYSTYSSALISSADTSKDTKKSYNELDKFVVSKLKSQNKYIVETESSESEVSHVSEYASGKVATVDNINEKTGTYSLVKLLSEENIVGSFGRLDTAVSIMPFEK